MDRLGQLRHSLLLDLNSVRTDALYRSTRDTPPSLEAYPTVAELLETMADESPDRYAERDVATRALIAKHQEGKATIWSSILLIAYHPMLSRLRRRIYSEFVNKDDLDQLVISTFLSVLGRFSLKQHKDRTAMFLRQITQRQVFKELRQAQGEKEEIRKLEDLAMDLGGFNPFTEIASDESSLDLDESAAILRRITHGIIDEENIELVIATVLRRERLKNYVYRRHSFGNRKEFRRIYERLKRRRTRALNIIAPLLADHFLCPRFRDVVLCINEDADQTADNPAPLQDISDQTQTRLDEVWR